MAYIDEGMAVRITGKDRSGRYSFEQEIITDTALPVLRIHTVLKDLQPDLRFFVLFKPAINNTGSQNAAHTNSEGLFATKLNSYTIGSGKSVHESTPVYAVVSASIPFIATSAGYVGFSDGWQDLARNFKMTMPWQNVGPGNVATTGEIKLNGNNTQEIDIAVSFGNNSAESLARARQSLSKPFEIAKSVYESGWRSYISTLENSPLMQGKSFFKTSSFARRSAQVIKMHEDKATKGAIVASLSKPGIPDSARSLDGTGGYHLIWPRDLYHAAMGLLAAGDITTATNVLRYFVKTQRPDGSWPQNFWIDGMPYWRGLQMDQVSFPILLASQLVKRCQHRLADDELAMITAAANFISSQGPTTQQDRWEEIGGYIPSTIAAEIAALRAASLLTNKPQYATTAGQWAGLTERWVMVRNGPHGRNYYLRVSPTGNPDDPEPIDLANGAGKAFASEIIDGGFLELVRLGVKQPNDQKIINTLEIYESPYLGIALADPALSEAMIYRRYNRDHYGAAHVGGYWPLLAGERGHYAVASNDLNRARAQLFLMERSALRGSMLLPEQTVNTMIVGLGVACPLAWAHAENILLHRSIEEQAVFDGQQD